MLEKIQLRENGLIKAVIAAFESEDRRVVLCELHSSSANGQNFATWRVDAEGNTFYGEYSLTYEEAKRSFVLRAFHLNVPAAVLA